MKIGIIGSGIVGQTLGTGLVGLGHQVKIGSREPNSEKLQEWVSQTGAQASTGTFAETAAFGDLIIISTFGEATENAVQLADPKNFSGKVVIDTTNPLVHGPTGPKVVVSPGESLGEKIQRLLPDAYVVKAFNTVPAPSMIDANYFPEKADMFICGNDEKAKQTVTEILTAFGWPVLDVGGIEEAFLIEALTGLWVKYMLLSKNWQHAFKVVRKA
jgi:predicted dinucleotide-binding enzyme